MNGITRIGLAAIGSLVVASAAMAQGAPLTPEQKIEAAVLTRQGLFKVQSAAFGPGRAPCCAQAERLTPRWLRRRLSACRSLPA
ncbi:MAG: hypothetical protein WDM77_10815 [Steroidobacteraceae bacterium]